jgi:hypothetical protein
MTSRRPLTALFAATLISAALTGCSHESAPEDRADDRTQENRTGSQASALTSDVEDAANNPSGTVEADAAADVFLAFDDALACADITDALTDGIDFAFDSSFDASCVVGSDLSGQVDLSCDGGGHSGSLSYEIGVTEAATYVYYEMNQVCDADSGDCISGHGAVEVKYGGNGVENVVAGEFTITRDGETHEVKYGVTQSVGSAGIQQEVVVWHNGQSFVVSQSIGPDGISYDLNGQNGSYSCDLSGSLSGSWGDLPDGDPTGYTGSLELSGSCAGLDGDFDFGN